MKGNIMSGKGAPQQALKSRIVGEGDEAPDQLLANPLNWRRHPKQQQEALEAMLRTVGWVQRVIVNRRTQHIVDGHLRVEVALRRNEPRVPVLYVDLTEEEEKIVLAAIDPIGGLAETDQGMLDDLLEGLATGDDDLDAFLQSLHSEQPTVVDDGLTDEDDAPEPQPEPITKPGDLWVMGQHRLLCGDSTVAESYERLMQGAVADMVFTDPPYNVNYANSAKDKMRGKDRAILNDNLGDGFYDFLLAALTPTVAHCRGGIYVAMSSSELDVLQAAFRAAGGKWSTFIIWAKNTFTLGRADYQRQYEPILYGWPEGATRHWCGDRDQGDVWNIKKPQKNDLHPTMKPVELVERAIRNSSRPGNVVLDPFGGSGTTLIAAEKSGRVARLIELDPKYVDVIVRRWEEFTGKAAVLEADGRTFAEVEAATLGEKVKG